MQKNLLKNIRDPLFLWWQRRNNYPFEHRRFEEELGYPLNLENPQSFNEKIVYTKIFNDNPLRGKVADKIKVRDFVRGVLGEKKANDILVPTYHITYSPKTIPFNELPEEYIVKASHGSGWNILVDKDHPPKPRYIRRKCGRWIGRYPTVVTLELIYRKNKPGILIEKLLRSKDGVLPKDYRFFVFHGKTEVIEVDVDRFTSVKTISYDANWNILPVQTRSPLAPQIPRPNNLEEMQNLAEKLGGFFDFIRVDLYTIGEKIFFGELTNFPEAGRKLYRPREFDFKLGKKWNLNSNPKYL